MNTKDIAQKLAKKATAQLCKEAGILDDLGLGNIDISQILPYLGAAMAGAAGGYGYTKYKDWAEQRAQQKALEQLLLANPQLLFGMGMPVLPPMTIGGSPEESQGEQQ